MTVTIVGGFWTEGINTGATANKTVCFVLTPLSLILRCACRAPDERLHDHITHNRPEEACSQPPHGQPGATS
jgi:hypothetical protein